jgi:O-antigen ligase
MEEGSPLDRVVSLTLIVLALRILSSRSFNLRETVAHNLSLSLFLGFALLSVTWSEFPFVSFKRWIRDLGNYLIVLVVLSEAHPLEAITTVIRRLMYLLVPLSVVLIKYFRELSVAYDPWTGTADYTGVTTSKNMLGAICLISGLFFVWDTLRRWPHRRERTTRSIIAVNLVLIGMTLWILNLAESATSRSCLVIGCAIIVAVQSRWGKANPHQVKAILPLVLLFSIALEMSFEVSSTIAQWLGRDPTLSGRTEIWRAVLAANTNPFLGTGYESFWLGDRLSTIPASIDMGFLNEAHNGYLETYLHLGLIGLGLTALFLVNSYRTICRRLIASPYFGSLSIALWAILLIYNVTEAALQTHIVWCIFMLFAVHVPVPVTASGVHQVAAKRLRPRDVRSATR